MSLLRHGVPAALILGAVWVGAAPAQGLMVLPPPASTTPDATPPETVPTAPRAAAPEPAPPPAAPTGPTVAAPVAVQASQLSAPDLFSAGSAPSAGLTADLWRGASVELARQVIPMLSARPLSPAAQAFALKLMSAAAKAPEGGGQDPDLGAARIGAVLGLGDAAGARAMLERTPGVRQNAALSQVAAEAALVLGREDEACAMGDTLAAGKDGPYWRRLRVFCLIRAGDKPGAQLAYDLTTEQAKDDVYKRLMGAAVTGSPAGDASLRNGLEYALSKRLQLDFTPALAKAWPPVLLAIGKDPTAPAPVQAAAAALLAQRALDVARASSLNPAVRDAALSVADNKLDAAIAEKLAADGSAGGVESKAGLALYAATGAPLDGRVRLALTGFDIGRSTANQARLLALADAHAKGDAALLALWLMADAGEAGPQPADRARLVLALSRAGFKAEARAYALEGLLGLQPAPPPAAKPAPAPAKKPPPALRKRR